MTSAGVGPVANLNDAPTGSVTISGLPTEDQTLTSGNTLADEDGLGTISYQWQRDGVDIGGATGSTYTLTQADVGTTITVVASYTDAQGTNESVSSAGVGPVANLNDAPTGTVTISGIATEDQTLTASNTLADEDGLGPISYQWQRDGVDIGGATGSTYTLTQADVGATITVVASYTDGQGSNESVTSAGVGPVANLNDAPTGTVTISGIATEDQTLTASNTLADEDALGTISYQWQRDGVDIGGATSSMYTLTQANVGTTITVVASYTDGQGSNESVTSAGVGPVANLNDAPTGTVTISGTPTQGQTLNVAHTLADEDGLGLISYRWQRDGVDVVGAISSTYTLTQSDVGAMITVVASYTDGHGTKESVTSTAVGPVANINDAPVGTPTIIGVAQEDQILTADTGGITDADGLGTFSYQWLRDGLAISGATQSTYTLGDADVGTQVSVQVRYTDGHGTAEGPLTSNPTPVVTNVNDVPVISGVDTGTVTEDHDPDQDGQLETTGSLSIQDNDAGEAFFNVDVVTGIHGNLTINASGNWTYRAGNSQMAIQSLQAGSTLTDVITVRTIDGTTHAISITITGVNDNPTPTDDFFSMEQGETLNLDASGVLANDSDIEGDSLSVAVVGGPANGTLTLNPDGSFTYTPNLDFVGADRFTYAAADGRGGNGISTVTINVSMRTLPPMAPHDNPVFDEQLAEIQDEPTDTEETPVATDDPITQDNAGSESSTPPTQVDRTARLERQVSKSAQEDSDPNRFELVRHVLAEKLDVAVDLVTPSQSENQGTRAERPDHQRSIVQQFVDVNINQLFHDFDTLTNDLNHVTNLRTIAFSGVVGVTTLATAGHAVLALRSGYFAMTALASLPSWKSFDLVPILDFQDKNRKEGKKKKKREAAARGVWSDELLQGRSDAVPGK